MPLRTLGGAALVGIDFTRPKPLLLLTYLAMEGRQDRRHLAELFWPGAADHMKSLTVALTRLRKGAPGTVEADGERAWATVDADAEQFLALLERGELMGALELYRGPFLDGFYLRDWSAELEEWVYRTREFLAAHARKALLELAEREATQGLFDEATRCAEAAYRLAAAPALEPEELARLNTLLCAGSSPLAAEVRSEAESFGVETVTSSDEARERLRRSEETPETPTPHNLPVRRTTFVGRDLELTEVATLLSRSDTPLLTLVGPPGVGKTRLAVQVASEQLKLGAFTGGIYLIPLESLTSASSIPAALADALEFDLQGAGDPLEQITKHIGDKDMLLLFDNAEHLTTGVAPLAELVKACPNLTLLVTSRERLNVEEERIFPVAGLPFPEGDLYAPTEARRFDAVKLFERRARRARPDFELTEENLAAVLKICRLVEGLPLGLELAAVWVRIMPTFEIAAELEQHSLDLLTTPTRNVPERHRSIRAAFEQSWKLLTPKEREVLRKLSVFRGGFRREAASEVAGATIPILASLLDKSLLRVDATGRYDRHPLVYGYTQEKLTKDLEEQSQVRKSHGSYYLQYLQKQEASLRGRRQKAALDNLDEELENIRAAWLWALEQVRVGELQTFVEALETFYKMRSRRQEGVSLFHEAARTIQQRVQKSNPENRAVLGHVLTAQARLCQGLGHYEEAVRLAHQGIALLRPFEDASGMIRGLDTLGRVTWRQGDYRGAKKYWEQALALAEREQDSRATATILGDIGIMEKELGNYERAQEHYLKALAANRKFGNYLQTVRSLNNLGDLNLATGHLAQAKGFLEEGLELAKEIGFQEIEAYFLFNLGIVAYEQGDYIKARTINLQALQQARESGNKALEAPALAKLARVETALGNPTEAQTSLLAALEMVKDVDDTIATLEVLGGFAELRAKQGRVEQAVRLASLVCHHPSTEQYDRKQAEQLLRVWRAQLSAKAMAEAVERGKEMSVEEVVIEVLREAAPRS